MSQESGYAPPRRLELSFRPPPSLAHPPRDRLIAWIGPGVLVAAALAAYHNCFSVPFLYDDATAIERNETIRMLWPLSAPLSPPTDVTTEGRPVLNLSFALNYATTGLRLGPLHATNLAIHIFSALTLFGLIRRTLRTPQLVRNCGSFATLAGLTVGGLWLLHPLQTQSVTYLVQRAEALMSLFYLLTLYCFVRGATEGHRGRWWTASLVSCALGMGSKEVMVSAPIIVFLYDRTFVAGSFAEAWRQRRWFHLGLAATWTILAAAVISTGGVRGGSAGFSSGMPWWVYSLTQLKAITTYLALAVWPARLVFDYGIVTVRTIGEVLGQAVLIASLAGAALWAVWRRPVAGFFGLWFFALLAPSSSVVPVVTETIAEHRMYLPLAALISLVTIACFRRFGWRVSFGAAALCVVLGLATERRNRDYQTAIRLWTDTVEKRPENPRAYNNLAQAFQEAGLRRESLRAYEEAARLKPDHHENQANLGLALLAAGRPEEALQRWDEAIRLRPTFADAHVGRGQTLQALSRPAEAIACFREAIRLRPADPTAYNSLGVLLGQEGQLSEALATFAQAIKVAPKFAPAHNNLGFGLKQTGRLEEAASAFRAAIEIKPDYAEAHNNLGLTLDQLGKAAEALPHFETVTRLETGYAEGHYQLGKALAATNRSADAIRSLQQCLNLQPNHLQAGALLAQLRDGQATDPRHHPSPGPGR